MAAITERSHGTHLAQIEPGDRLVALARTMHAQYPEAEIAIRDSAANYARFGATGLGQALYRHRSVFQSDSEAQAWSHLELGYFKGIVPRDAIQELVVKPQLPGTHLLRAEILLTTPSSFVLPRNWRGSAEQPERQVSIEYIRVEPRFLSEYRDVMRNYCGPAAAKLVEAGRFGTFRSMETAAVLHHDPSLKIDWNQIHICELDPTGFRGFGSEFEAALRQASPANTQASGVFADLDRIRTVPRWTFNDPVLEADATIAREGNSNF